MRLPFAALTFVLCAGWLPPAHAQQWGLQSPGRALSGMGIVHYQSRDWAQCAGGEQVQPTRAISACGRIIGERVSREVTAAAYYYRSALHRQAGNAERADADAGRALQLLTELVQAEPENPYHFDNLIFLRMEMRDFAGAAADYGRAATLRPQDADARIGQAGFLFRAGDYASAVTIFDAAAEISPGNAKAHSGRCEARVAANIELDIAEQACAEALRLSEQSSAALFSRGFYNFARGRIEDALADFEASGRQDNTNPFAAYGFAVASLRLGIYQEQASALLANVTTAVPEVEMYAQAGLRP